MFLSLIAPIAPAVLSVTDVTVTNTVAEIYLWPAEQRNGPVRWLLELCAFPLDGVDCHVDDALAFGASGTVPCLNCESYRLVKNSVIPHNDGIQWTIKFNI